MGISTLQSYQGSQIFEAIGINSDVVNKYFTNTVSRVEGISLKDLEKDVDARHAAAFDPLGLENDLILESEGSHKYRSGKEQHLYIQERSIRFRQRQGPGIIRCLKNIPI